MSKEMMGGQNCNINKKEEKPKFKKYEPITEKRFREIIGSELESPEGVIELWVKKLNNSLENISEKTNGEYKVAINSDDEEYGTRLVDIDGTIMIESFQKSEGGPYMREDKEFKKDKKKVKELEKKWHKEEKEKNFGELWEKAKTVILNKIIGTGFIVVRASKHDDYENGVDNVIIDKEAGNVVCAFDEVSAEEGTEKEAEKSEKVEEKNKKGGATIKYGITVNEENKIIKKEIKNIPVFYLRLSGRDLVKTLSKMNFKSEKPSEIELEVFGNLINSLKGQLEELKNKDIPEDENKEAVKAMIVNAKKFEKSLEKMKECRKGFNVDESKKEKQG